jgi:hypothetical protein
MVAREGTAPSISGCRPDAILFHQRAGKGVERCKTPGRLEKCPIREKKGKKWSPYG